jgi:hypothetical protein
MQQIKIFKGIESELGDLEARVNAWLRDSGARVVQSFGNIAPQSLTQSGQPGLSKSYTPSDVLIILVYEKP